MGGPLSPSSFAMSPAVMMGEIVLESPFLLPPRPTELRDHFPPPFPFSVAALGVPSLSLPFFLLARVFIHYFGPSYFSLSALRQRERKKRRSSLRSFFLFRGFFATAGVSLSFFSFPSNDQKHMADWAPPPSLSFHDARALSLVKRSAKRNHFLCLGRAAPPSFFFTPAGGNLDLLSFQTTPMGSWFPFGQDSI